MPPPFRSGSRSKKKCFWRIRTIGQRWRQSRGSCLACSDHHNTSYELPHGSLCARCPVPFRGACARTSSRGRKSRIHERARTGGGIQSVVRNEILGGPRGIRRLGG